MKKSCPFIIRFIIFIVVSVFCLVGCAKAGQDVANAELKDLNNSTIILYPGSPIHNHVAEKYPDANLIYLGSTADMMLYTKQGKADYFIVGNGEFLQIDDRSSISTLDEEITQLDYAFIFNENRLDVRKQFNEFLARCKENGTLNELEKKWVFDKTDRSIDRNFSGENGTLHIATEAKHVPFTFVYNGEIVGYEIELISLFAHEYGYNLEIENVNWDPMFVGVIQGKYDIGCSDIMYTSERAEEVHFSDITYSDKAIVAYFSGSAYPDLSYFSGKKVAVDTGTVFDSIIKNTEQIKNPEFLYYRSDADVMNAIRNGKADFGCYELPIIQYMEKHGGGVKPASESLSEEHVAFVFAKGNSLVQDFNRVISDLRADGTVDRLMDKWINSDETTRPVVQDWVGENGELTYWSMAAVPPLAFMGADNELFGVDYDIALLVCKELGYNIKATPVEFSSILGGVSSGRVDIGGGTIAVTEERAQSVDFTDVIYDCPVGLFVSAEKKDRTGLFASITESFKKTFIVESRWKLFVSGIVGTVVISVISVVFGTALGFGFYLIFKKGNRIVLKIADIYQWFINGIPVIVLLMILYYIVLGKTKISGLWVSSIGFVLIFASGVLGMLRSGVGAVDPGQREGGLALGYTENQTFFKIVLPQAARIFMPSYVNEVVQTIKATAVVGYIAVQDVTKVSDLVRSRTYEPFFPLIVSAVIYFVLAWLLTIGFKKIIKMISPVEDRSKRAVYLEGVVR